MELEKQVVSSEIARQLKEAGYPQNESLHYWAGTKEIEWRLLSKYVADKIIESELIICAAPTVADLGEQLLAWIAPNNETLTLVCVKSVVSWSVFYSKLGDSTDTPEFRDNSEANARAKMWLYLKKEGLL